MNSVQTQNFDPRLNGFQIKLFAAAAMLIDHIGAFLISYDSQLYPICRSIGRLAFPIFCLMIAEGARHTRSVPKYIGRLAVCAVISTPPYNLVHGAEWYSLEDTNVFFTLLLGLAAIGSIKNLAPWILRRLGKSKSADNKKICVFLGTPFCIALYFAAYALNTDYGGYGVATIVIFYLLRDRQNAAWISFALLTFISYDFMFFLVPDAEINVSASMVEMNLYDIIKNRLWDKEFTIKFYNARQMLAVFAFIPTALYNEQKGRDAKYFFYLFYPIHLTAIWMIQLLIK